MAEAQAARRGRSVAHVADGEADEDGFIGGEDRENPSEASLDGWTISDLGSTNGTMIEGAPITQRELEDGDQIVIGETVLEFRTT